MCDVDPTKLGTGDCYRCAPFKDKTAMLRDATEIIEEKLDDGTTRTVERIDVDKLGELFVPVSKVSLKLRRHR